MLCKERIPALVHVGFFTHHWYRGKVGDSLPLETECRNYPPDVALATLFFFILNSCRTMLERYFAVVLSTLDPAKTELCDRLNCAEQTQQMIVGLWHRSVK